MSDRDPKAKGMGWLSPYLVVKDVKNSVEFYKEAFGFETKMTMPDKEGNIVHAEMTHKDAVIMMGPECAEQGTKSPTTLNGSPVNLYLYVDDVNKQFDNAKSGGAKIIMEPTDQFWGDRTCVVSCPEGHQWTFAQNVADFDPTKVPG